MTNKEWKDAIFRASNRKWQLNEQRRKIAKAVKRGADAETLKAMRDEESRLLDACEEYADVIALFE